MEVTEIGLRSECPLNSDTFLTFSTEVTNARFHALGTTPVPREMLMMCVITGVSSAAQLRKTQCGMSSGPGDVFFIVDKSR